ncbi:MAG TPA: Spy/CpxP family protein refolding chaperone [Coleofasciculaceae cyanobacterium]|jgi:Spy/CpxP family protein refolding chaperone
MQKLGSLFCALLAACLLAQPGWAQDDCTKVYAQQIKDIRREYAKFADRANLTTDQRSRLHAIKQATDQQVESISRTIVDKQRALIQYLFSPGATQATAEQLTQEIAQMRCQIAFLKLGALTQARNVMTEEQQRQFALFHQQIITSMANKYPACLQPLSHAASE